MNNKTIELTFFNGDLVEEVYVIQPKRFEYKVLKRTKLIN
jgi:hypothetical protein